MSFVERVLEHVRRVQQIAEGGASDKRVVIDYGRHRACAREMLEAAEQAVESNPAELNERLEEWMTGRLDTFVEELHWAILAGWGADLTLDDRSTLVDAGIVLAARLPSSSRPSQLDAIPSFSRARLLQATAAETWQMCHDWRDHILATTWPRVTRYCAEIGLVGEREDRWFATEAGRLLSKLRGKEVVEWLLALETNLAIGMDDPWRVTTGWLTELRRQGSVLFDDLRSMAHGDVLLHHLERLAAMGALSTSLDEDGEAIEWKVSPLGAKTFDAIERGSLSPLMLLARAMLEDEVHALTKSMGQPNNRGGDYGHGERIFRHTRMVAHEVRNALGPVQHAARRLRGDLRDVDASASVLEHLDAIDHGIRRLHRFVTESVRLVPPESVRVEPFSVLEAIADARKELTRDGIGSLTIETVPASADPRCHGNRGQFVMAMLNVLRNAQQAKGHDVRIAMRLDARDPAQVMLSIDDDGPGVPDAVREHIFENGVSYREGGTGHGLASLRAVVEDIGGEVRCTNSELGGARFEIMLPAVEDSP